MAAPASFCPDSWGIASCRPEGGCSHLENLNPDLREIVETAAKEYLWRWSGRRFGLCEIQLRPCEESCFRGSTYRGWSGVPAGYPFAGLGMFPIISGGNWFNIVCGKCRNDRCGCSDLSTIMLPGRIYDVVSVFIDGQLLDPSAYRLDNLGLSRIDGGSWARCQNMANAPIDDESPVGSIDTSDTFMVVYRIGEPVPAGGQLAAGTLACEMAKRTCGDNTCRLPRRASVVVREGTTVVMPTDELFFTKGITGIFEIDNFLASVQEENRSGYLVSSPDVKRFRAVW